MEFFPGTHERFRNSCGKRAVNVPAIEVLLYLANYEGFSESNANDVLSW